MTPIETEPLTSNLKMALLNAHGKTLLFNGRKYKLQSGQVFSKYLNRFEFSAVALLLTPKTPEEAKFCYWDLWHSDADCLDSADLLFRFAKLGGYSPEI